jgi:accessory gene regulator B
LDHKIDVILYRLNKDNYFTDIQLEQIKYALQVILGDLSKFLILLTLFTLMNHGLEFLYAYVATFLLRIYIGGKHFDTYFSCLLFSLVYFSVLILLTTLVRPEYLIYLLLLTTVFALVLLIIAPRVSKRSGRNFKMKRSKVKTIIFLLITLYIIISFVMKEPIYSIGPLTIILQTIQLLLMKGGSYYEIRKETRISV